MKIFSLIIAFVVFSADSSAAEYDSLLEKFKGDWHSDGAAFRTAAESEMSWRFALDEQFVRLDYRIEMQNDSNTPRVFQGVAFYKLGQGDGIDAFWADNSGDLHPITVILDGDALIANWGVAGGKQGRTRYELLTFEKMEITDWIKTPDEWREFNKNVFTRIQETDLSAVK